MIKIERSTIINAPIDRVWAVLRDFNGHASWHPAVRSSEMENGAAVDQVGSIRRFRLGDGSELREQLLTHSDHEKAYSYCLLDTPVPLLNYVSHVSLLPVTDGERTFWRWTGEFNAPRGQERALEAMVSKDIYLAGFAAVAKRLAS